ncbi:MAG: PAS domain-containing protein [Deltaproteobacteria bacterium]|nr:MAG: PAS domain-containing protein [Deltaproteobacteria bacterium]
MARSAGATKQKPRKEAASGGDLEEILRKIRETRNFDFRNYKRPTLLRRIQRRMQDRGKRTVREYGALLDRDAAEFDALLGSMFIKVTSFFRDPEVWQELSSKAIPQMLSEKRPGEEIRVWSAGCATGEEAFSAAIVLAEAMGPSFGNQDVKIFGTDVDEKAIAHARKGQYARDQVESVSKKALAEWFIEEGDGYAVRKELRRSVIFGINNLVSDAPISRLDLLICRNVFIYLDAALQKRVLSRFHYALRQHGILMLGKSELIPFAARIYEPIDLARRIYRKDGRRDSAVSQERLVGLLEQESVAREIDQETEKVGSIDQFHREVLQSLPLPVIATTLDGSVMLWNGAAARLWNRRETETTGKKLAALSLPGLAGDLLIEKTAAVREGRSERERGDGVLARASEPNGIHLSVEVSPLRDATGENAGLVYLVHDVTSVRRMESELRQANQERQTAYEELQTVNEEMQSSNEELETTNEELQSANEELQTTNEELQSTNEELETTNEELQSTNAELDATNRELAHRTEEMNKLAFNQRVIIRSLSAALIVLDGSGKIIVWNLAAERLLGLTEGEAVGQVLWTLHIPALNRGVLAKVSKALAQNLGTRSEELDYELPNGGLGKATLAAVPIVDGGAPLGAVLMLEDMSRMAALQAEIARLRENDARPAQHR